MFEGIGTEEIAYGVGAVVLLVVLAYGVIRSRGRNKRVDPITEAATREQYEHPERYEQTQRRYEQAAERVEERTGKH